MKDRSRHRDVATRRRAVEGRAALVVQDADAEITKKSPDGCEFSVHFIGCHRAGRTRNTNSLKVSDPCQLLRLWNPQEEKGLMAEACHGRERIRRSGEIVSIPPVGRCHGSTMP